MQRKPNKAELGTNGEWGLPSLPSARQGRLWSCYQAERMSYKRLPARSPLWEEGTPTIRHQSTLIKPTRPCHDLQTHNGSAPSCLSLRNRVLKSCLYSAGRTRAAPHRLQSVLRGVLTNSSSSSLSSSLSSSGVSFRQYNRCMGLPGQSHPPVFLPLSLPTRLAASPRSTSTHGREQQIGAR